MNSRTKGKVGERELSAWLNAHGFQGCRRGQQFSGANGDADVVGIPGIHLEVKRVENLNLHAAMAQAVSDCGENAPVVAHRRNRGEWMLTVRAEDFERVAKNWLAQSRGGDGGKA